MPFSFYRISFTEFTAAPVDVQCHGINVLSEIGGEVQGDPFGARSDNRLQNVLSEQESCQKGAQFRAEVSPRAPNAFGTDQISQVVAHQV